MLREITMVRQVASGLVKRCFISEEMDLYIWITDENASKSSADLSNTDLSNTDLSNTGLSDTGLSDTGLSDTGLSDTGLKDTGIEKFELSYNKLSKERAISWHSSTGFHYFKVDDGSYSGKTPKTPIMTETQQSKPELIITEIEEELSEVDYKTAKFIISKLEHEQS